MKTNLKMVLCLLFSLTVFCLFCVQHAKSAVPSCGSTNVLIPRHQPEQMKDIKSGGKKIITAKNSVRFQQVQQGNTYQQDLPGEWDNVVGHVGFRQAYDDLPNAFVSVIGLPTFQLDEDSHETGPWDRKVFWIYMDEGGPQHFSGDFQGVFEDETTGEQVYIYSAQNILYQRGGVDYTGTEYNGEWTYIEIVTDFDNNVLEYYLYLLDENDEIAEETTMQIGDRMQSWTTVLDLDDPSIIWLNTIEGDLRTITVEPRFSFEHLTPDVDFVVEKAPNFLEIDFSQKDLYLVLWGYYQDPNIGIERVKYSDLKDMQTKWDDQPVTAITNWFTGLFE